MIFGDDRKQLRQMYFDSWNKAQQGQPLTPLESQIADVVDIHPEYQSQLTGDSAAKIDQDYQSQRGDVNPFLHMGLHLGLREQLSTSRPPGIKKLFDEMVGKVKNSHRAEHLFMDILSQFIWEAQKSGTTPDDKKYLQQLKNLLQQQS